MTYARRRSLLFMVGLSVFLLCLSLSAGLLHWRVENEPGAASSPGLLTAHFVLLAAGLAGLGGSSVPLFRNGDRPLRGMLVAAALAVLVYSPLFLLTLMMLA